MTCTLPLSLSLNLTTHTYPTLVTVQFAPFSSHDLHFLTLSQLQYTFLNMYKEGHQQCSRFSVLPRPSSLPPSFPEINLLLYILLNQSLLPLSPPMHHSEASRLIYLYNLPCLSCYWRKIQVCLSIFSLTRECSRLVPSCTTELRSLTPMDNVVLPFCCHTRE